MTDEAAVAQVPSPPRSGRLRTATRSVLSIVATGTARSRPATGQARKGAARGEFRPQAYARPGVSEADVLEMKAAFDMLEPDGEGVLDLEDALDTLESLKPPRLEQQPLMVALRQCRQEGAMVDFGGFVGAMAPLLVVGEPNETNLLRVWGMLDPDRRGVITVEELRALSTAHGLHLAGEELATMVKVAGGSENGEVSYEGFSGVLRGSAGQH